MKYAIDMSPLKYRELQDNLNGKAKAVFARSKQNLKMMIS